MPAVKMLFQSRANFDRMRSIAAHFETSSFSDSGIFATALAILGWIFRPHRSF
jgi:hypothetical protein